MTTAKTTSKKTPPRKTATKVTKKATVSKATKASAKKTDAAKKAQPKKSTKKAAYTEAVQMAATTLFELRALHLELLNLQGISETSDFMILATCESEAQMQAILDALSKDFKAKKMPYRTEYKPGINMRWAVFDAGFDLIVQLFEESKREELAFDKLYGDATITKLEEKDFIQAKAKKVKIENELI